MTRAGARSVRSVVAALIVVCWSAAAFAQSATVARRVNLRSDPSTGQPPVRLLVPPETLTLVSVTPQAGYYHVRTSAGEEGWVWGRDIRIQAAPPAPPATPPSAVSPGPGVPGSASVVGCGDGFWKHVYHPQRLLVKQDCITVTGVIVDATANQSHHRPDGVRHEPDGDTHGWLRVDPQFANLLDAGNMSAEGGNLVFEVDCHFTVTQADAKPACAGFADHTAIPPVGTHVAMTGTFVQDTNHGQWNEIHPVSSITVH